MTSQSRRQFLKSSSLAVAYAVVGTQAQARAAQGDELTSLDATAQADLVRRKEVTPLELVDAAIARIEQHDGRINSVVARTFDEARAAATGDLPEGPFRGVPYLVKDLCPLKGVKLTYGCRFFKDYVPDHTALIIERAQQAGMVVVGKSNTPEFGLLPVTEPVLHGPSRNPWDHRLSPGGSSGGAAAAVAARFVPVAHAGDGGGSIRIPASCCGLFGLKISRGRNPDIPMVNDQGLSVQHCVSRSVRDSAALLDVTRGPVPGDRWWAPPPEQPYAECVKRPPQKLRIALAMKDLTGALPHDECVNAVNHTARLCEDLGHVVEPADLPLVGPQFAEAFMVIWAAMAGAAIKGATAALGAQPPREAFETWTWKLAEKDAGTSAADLIAAWRVMQPLAFQMAQFQSKYDVVLTPVLGSPPIAVGEIDPEASYDEQVEKLTRYVSYTPLANGTGQPAASVPLYWTADGAPVGSQLIGRFGDEATLLALAAQLEQAQPWATRTLPPLDG